MISASRGAAVPSRHRRDSFPSDEVVGGLLFDFEAVRTASKDRDAPRRCARRICFPSRLMLMSTLWSKLSILIQGSCSSAVRAIRPLDKFLGRRLKGYWLLPNYNEQ